MNIPLTEFLDIVSYNKLFNYVYLPSKTGAEILLEDPTHEICFVESINFELCCVWYPISSWIDEIKRRKEMEKSLLDFSRKPKLIKDDKVELNKLLIKAAMRGDFNEVNRITERMKKL